MRRKTKRVLRLRQLRGARVLTLEQTAQCVGLSLSNYAAIEAGKQSPNLETAKTIAEFFGETVDEVFKVVEIKVPA